MMDQRHVEEQYETFKRLAKRHPEDEYWKGGMMAIRSVLEEFVFEE